MPKIVPCFEVEYLHTLYHKPHSLVELMQMQEAAARGRSTRASRWRRATRSQNNPHAALYALYRPRNLHLSSITSHSLSYGVQRNAAQCKGGSTRKVPLAPIQSQSLHPGYPPIHNHITMPQSRDATASICSSCISHSRGLKQSNSIQATGNPSRGSHDRASPSTWVQVTQGLAAFLTKSSIAWTSWA